MLNLVLNKIHTKIRKKQLIITGGLNVDFSGHSNDRLILVDVL